MALLTTITVGNAKARVGDDLTRARDVLAIGEEDGCRLEAEVSRLAVERMPLY